MIGCLILMVGSLITGWVLELFNVTGCVFIFVLLFVFVFVIGWLFVLFTLVKLLLANGLDYCGLGWRGGKEGDNTFVLLVAVVVGFVFTVLLVLIFEVVVVIGLVLILVLLPIGWSPFNGYTFVYPKLFLTTISLIFSLPLYPNWLLLLTLVLLNGFSFTGDTYFLGYYIFFISFFLLSLYSCNSFTHDADNDAFSHIKFHSPISFFYLFIIYCTLNSFPVPFTIDVKFMSAIMLFLGGGTTVAKGNFWG